MRVARSGVTGAAEAPCAPRSGREILHDFEGYLDHRNEHHLCDAVAGVDAEGAAPRFHTDTISGP